MATADNNNNNSPITVVDDPSLHLQSNENVGFDESEVKSDVPEDSGKLGGDVGGDNGNSGVMQTQQQDPTRPEIKDCLFYVHTGSCSFGSACRFNHPASVDHERNNGNNGSNGNNGRHSGNSFGNSPRIPCKFYLSGFCKFGATCRYNHAIPPAEAERMQLQQYNSLGLPHRLGEKICSFYMRTGLCGFGGRCKFHHPEPVFIKGPKNCNPYASREDGSAGITNARYIIQFPDSPQPYVATPMPQHTSFQYMHPENYGWNNGYQVPEINEGMQLPSAPAVQPANFSCVAPAVDGNPNPVVDHFPRLSKPLVLARTLINIPRGSKPIPVLNEVGLPMRPGRKVCWHYNSSGVCGYGAECIFDHPPRSVEEGSTSEYGRSDETPETEEK